ncbi:MAG: hypothetical protein FJ302_16660 [Planctomycetes bacterium]|nr:hypothetical protein [Planctomycetota bacterium]
MKKFGIWLVILVILLAAGGMHLASRLTMVRSSWQKKTAEGRAKVLDLRKKAAESQKLVDSARSDLQQAILGWDWYRISPQVTKGARPGVLGVGLGTSHGLQPNSVVYVFQPSADGAATSFVGPFKVVAAQLQEASATLVPNWRLRPEEEEESQTWRYGPNWRIRSNIPLDHKTQFSKFEMMILTKDELLAAQQQHLQLQQNAKAKAEEHLSLRMKELKGDPDQANQSLDKFLLEGYHKAVADLEIARNAVQADVDELRRQIKRTRDEIERLTQDNGQLAEEGSSDVPKAATSQK